MIRCVPSSSFEWQYYYYFWTFIITIAIILVRRPANGHFTAMVNEKQTSMGCGLIQYKSGRFYNLFLVCNYAMTNVLGAPVYQSGTACSGCTTGCHPICKGLCNENEPIVAEPWTRCIANGTTSNAAAVIFPAAPGNRVPRSIAFLAYEMLHRSNIIYNICFPLIQYIYLFC